MDAIRTGPRVRAPELIDGAWFNTDGPLTLAGLRGRFVLLDFWTFCCGNCLHVLDELRAFEEHRADVLTVIGVHSPKFPHEADPRALAAAIERYEVRHPVLNDPSLHLWQQYAVRAWPTLVLVDPEGYVVAQAAGEGQVSALDRLLDELVPRHSERGTLRRGDTPYTAPIPTPSTLRFPAKAIILPKSRTGRAADSLLVADAGHHQIVELALDGETVLRRIGSGRRGEPFAEPNGLALLPEGAAAFDVLVADTGNHVVRGVDVRTGTVTATFDLADLLRDELTVTGAVPLALSPWDVAWWPAAGQAVVAAAGVHLLLALDPRAGSASVLAGTTVEGLRDGAALDAWLAQPSGLAPDGDVLWFADAETSALRTLDTAGVVRTHVGEGLFDFGHVDGQADAARFQHPLGVAALPDGSVAVLDTYNGAVRRYDPRTEHVSTLARGLSEPSGAIVRDGALIVVESAAHRLTATPLADEVVTGEVLTGEVLTGEVVTGEVVTGEPQRTERPAAALRAGEVRLEVLFRPPPGRKLDDRDGPATRVTVTASPPGLLAAGGGEATSLARVVTLRAGIGVLHVTAHAASCDDDPAVEHPACHLARQDWGVPVTVGRTGDAQLELTLLG